MYKLNNMEYSIMKSIIEYNKVKYPFLEEHFKNIIIKNRNYTNVGIYVNFEYIKLYKEQNINVLLSSDKELYIEGLKYELNYILDITNGNINYLEIVSNDDNDILTENTNYNFKLE